MANGTLSLCRNYAIFYSKTARASQILPGFSFALERSTLKNYCFDFVLSNGM